MTWYIEGIGFENPRNISASYTRNTSTKKIMNGSYVSTDRGLSGISFSLTVEQYDPDWTDGSYQSSITNAIINEIEDNTNPQKTIISSDGKYDGTYLVSSFTHNEDATRPNLIIYTFTITKVL